jgi:hypothetical protein
VEDGLSKSLVGKGRLPECSVPVEEYDTCPRQDKMKRYKPKYLMDKQVKLAVLYCSGKQEYISTRKNVVNCRNNYPKYEIIIGQMKH